MGGSAGDYQAPSMPKLPPPTRTTSISAMRFEGVGLAGQQQQQRDRERERERDREREREREKERERDRDRDRERGMSQASRSRPAEPRRILSESRSEVGQPALDHLLTYRLPLWKSQDSSSQNAKRLLPLDRQSIKPSLTLNLSPDHQMSSPNLYLLPRLQCHENRPSELKGG